MSYNQFDCSRVWGRLSDDYEEAEDLTRMSRPINAGIGGIEPQQPRDETLGSLLGDSIANLWRWVGVILLATSAGVGLAIWALQMIAPVYQSKTALLFDFSRQAVVSGLPADTVAPTEVVLNTEMEFLTSASFIDSLVDALDLTQDPEFNPWRPDGQGRLNRADPEPQPETLTRIVGENLSDQIQVKLVPDTYVFEITAKSADPDKAALIARTMAALFIQNRDIRGRDTVKDATVWLDDRMRGLRQQTLEAERAFHEKMRTTPRNGEAALESLIVQIELIQDRRNRLTSEIDGLARLALALTLHLENKEPEAARASLDDWLAQVPAQDWAQGLVQMIHAIPANGAATAEIDATNTEIKALLRAKTSERDRLDTDLQGIEAQYDQISTAWLELKDLERAVLGLEAIYGATLDQQKTEATGRTILPFLPDVNIISDAQPPSAASYPNRKIFLGLGGLAGAFIGVVLATAFAASFPVVRSARDINRLPGVFLAGQIALRRNPALQELLGKARNTKSALYRATQNIQIALFADSGATSQKAYLFLSTSEHRVALSLAYLLAQIEARDGNRVLVVELCLDDPRIMPDAPLASVADLLNEKNFDPTTVFAHHEESGVDILRVKAEIEGGDETLLPLLRHRKTLPVFKDYNVINVVCKPTDQSHVAYLLATHVDLAILAIETNRTRRDDLQTVVDRFQRNRIWRMASVLVRARG